MRILKIRIQRAVKTSNFKVSQNGAYNYRWVLVEELAVGTDPMTGYREIVARFYVDANDFSIPHRVQIIFGSTSLLLNGHRGHCRLR
jgi:hypothetical protein